MPLPHPKPLPSYWISPPSDLANHRTTEDLPEEVDVLIIGSGYTGAATAYYLLQNPDGRPSTVILEARDACSGATARNGGHVKPDLYMNTTVYEKMFGAKVARELTDFEIQQVLDVKRLVETEDIDCDFELTRAIDVFVDRRISGPTIQAYQSLRESGYEYPDDLHFISNPQKAEQVSGVKGALAAYSFTAGSIWPYKLVCHLLRRCLEWGANLQTHTPVLSLSEGSDDNGYWTVTTERGSIRTKKVVLATNAYTSTLLPDFHDKITPARGVATRIAVSDGGKRAPHLNNTYCIRYGPQEYDYLISRTDGSIVVGGAKQVVLTDESYWHNNINDSELIPGADGYFNDYMQRTFYGWEDTDAKVTHIWTGAMGYSSDLMPWIGELPEKRGLYVAAGFTGHGMPRILGCASAIASLIRGGVQDLSETPIPAPYWITTERLNAKRDMTRDYMAGSRQSS